MSSDMYAPRHAAPEDISTQQLHPWRTTLRTVAWYVVAVLAAIPLAAPIIRDQLGAYLGDRAVSAMMWTAGLAGALLAAVQRIVLLAPVAELLSRAGLGTGHGGEPAALPEAGDEHSYTYDPHNS